MKKKINIQFMVIASAAIIFTLALVIGTFYELFKEQIFGDLKTYTHLLQSSNELIEEGSYHGVEDGLRITVINKDGSVRYDSNVDAGELDNHKNRPEVQEALEAGEGKIIRTSETLQKSTFYYAALLEDGSILRVAKEADNIWSIFMSVMPVMTAIIILLFCLCLILSHFLTKSIVQPIEQMAQDMEQMKAVKTYEELQPFVTTIKRQHEDIVRNANMRQDFTANVSHELKTPLTSISGYAELIENGMASEADIHRFAKEIHKNAKRLLSLINDIIKLSELDAIESSISFERVNLYDLAETCVNMLQINAEKQNVTLFFSGVPCTITANKDMVEELLYNLCDNAIRYNTAGGSVWVEVKEENGQPVIKVKDTGIGIPAEHRQRIFERFYRVDKSRSKSTGGTGLGLAIVKHIVAKHNAEIELSSEVGAGTEIKIIFQKQ